MIAALARITAWVVILAAVILGLFVGLCQALMGRACKKWLEEKSDTKEPLKTPSECSHSKAYHFHDNAPMFCPECSSYGEGDNWSRYGGLVASNATEPPPRGLCPTCKTRDMDRCIIEPTQPVLRCVEYRCKDEK